MDDDARCFYRSTGAGVVVDPCGWSAGRNYSGDDFPVDSRTQYVYLVGYPLILLLGTAGNAFCLKMFVRKKKRTVQLVCLMTLCFANIFVMWLDLPVYLGCYMEKLRSDDGLVDALERTAGTLMWTQHTFLLLSNWVLVLHMVLRLATLTRPTWKPESWHGFMFCSGVALLSLLFCIPHILFYQQWYSKIRSRNPACDLHVCRWLDKYTRLHHNLDIGAFEVGMTIVTYGFVLVLCVAVFAVVFVAHRKRSGASQEKGDPKEMTGLSNGEAREAPAHISLGAHWFGLARPNKMLSRSVIFFLLTQIPDVIFVILIVLASYPSCTINISEPVLIAWHPIVHMISLLNYSLNFLLYVGLLDKWKPKQRVLVPASAVRPLQYELVPRIEKSKVGPVLPTVESKVTRKISIFNRKKKPSNQEAPKIQSIALVKAVGTLMNDQQFRELWTFLPYRLRIFQPVVIFTTNEDGVSLFNFFLSVRGHNATIIMIKTMKGELFGAFCGDSWDDRVHGKKEYLFFGTGETFLFAFDPVLKIYPWIGLCGRRTTPDSCLFMAADSRSMIIGGGGGNAICFEASLARGFSSHSATFDNPPLCEDGIFEAAVVEIYGFEDMILDTEVSADGETDIPNNEVKTV